MITRSRKYLKIGPYGLLAGGIIAIAMGIRIVLIAMGWPATNSDEATMGLMARHIAYNGEHPVFFYGQNYMGSLEAHIGAALFFIFGPSLFSLRLSLILLYSVFLVALYLLTSLLYAKKFALAMLILFSLGSIEMLTRQVKAVGGAVETMLFGCVLILLSSWLVLTYRRNTLPTDMRRRWLAYGCFGLAMGLGLWSHLLILAFVAASLVFLAFFCHRELRLPFVSSFGVGLVLGFLPSLIFNIRHPAQNSLGTLWQLHSSGGTATSAPFTLWDSIRGTVLVSLPMATGANPQCPVPDTPGVWRAHITSCLLVQGLWGVGFLLLYGIVLFLLVRTLVKYFKKQKAFTPSDDERRTMLLDAARLTLLASGGLTLLAYVVSPAPALVPLTSTRYLVGLLVMFPVLLAPLWDSALLSRDRFITSFWQPTRLKDVKTQPVGTDVSRPFRQLEPQKDAGMRAVVGTDVSRPARISIAKKDVIHRSLPRGKSVLFFLVYAVYFIGTVGVFQQVPTVQATNQQQEKMVNDLLALHTTHIYSDYWTCNRVIFQSKEQIICSSLDERLQPQENRYPRYETIVEHDVQAAYVFPTNSLQAQAFSQRLAQSKRPYQRMEIDDYVVFKPTNT